MKRSLIVLALAVMVASMVVQSNAALPGFIKFKNGYFYDNVTGETWVPHGIAYQTWNRPLGVWQTKAQIDYDLDEMVKMGANSIRVDFVWQHIEEDGDNQWKWDNYDYLVSAAEKRNIRIFALIGYQWPPNWFPDEWYTKHPPAVDAEGIAHTNRWQSDIINYEHPDARAQYAEWFQNVCSRYATNKAIVGWIIGNESGYLGLWSGLLDGYDPESEAAFRAWAQAKYVQLTNLNARWGTAITNFNDIKFVEQYRAYGVEGAIWADMVQWREDSIGTFTAIGAKAAKAADTNHMIAYSTVGMQWGEEDWRYHAEDRGKITQACEATNAPVDFFAVNNYPWSILGHESQNGQWGISYTKKVTISAAKPEGVPVLYSETGFTSSESMWPGMNEYRQGPLVRNALWESLAAGAVGTHIFAWHDRPYITDREKGFGILTPERRIKPAFWDSASAFQLMEQAKIGDLLMGSKDPKPDIGFLWTAAVDSQYNRYECEMQQVAGALERLGYEPNFVNLNDLASGNYTNYKVLVLPRNMRVDTVVPNSTNKPVLKFLRENVLAKGIHILATADLPGLQDENGRPMANFTNEMVQLFGIDASDVGGYEVPAREKTFVGAYMRQINVTFTNAMGPVTNGYKVTPGVWKYNDEVKLNGGTVWATMDTRRNKGFEDSATGPAQWGAWGNTAIQSGWGWQYSGQRMLQMWGDSGVYQEWDIVPFGRYTFSAYLRNNSDDPLRSGAGGYLQIEWYGQDGRYLGSSESAHLRTNTPGNAWVKYVVDDLAPSNSWMMRRLIRMGPDNMLVNGQLTGSGLAPSGWSQWNDGSHDPCSTAFAGTSGNSWRFWWDGGIFQDITTGFAAGELIKFGGYLYTPGDDRLRNGTKHGTIQVEFYNGATLLSSATAGTIAWATTNDVWTRAYAEATVPSGANLMRFIIRCNDFSSGDGAFMADDVFLKNGSRGAGSLYVDNLQENPALVVKNHGAAKAAIYLFTAGDVSPDGNGDGEMDILPWKWRYDYFGAIVRDYFGVQPLVRLIGTNACYFMAEYRTCTNGATLWQVKNYLYDRFQPNGGAAQTFTIQSTLFTGRTVRAFEQGRILETNSDGIISITLVPDGHDMLLAYMPGTNRQEVVQISGSPSIVHPGGDKVHLVQVQYDCAGTTNLKLKAAFKEVGDNGDGATNEIYAVVTNAVTASGKADLYLWVPTYRQTDPDYKSTLDGGKYEFAAWLENGSGVKIAQSVPRPVILEWGVRPTSAVPTNIAKGATVTLPFEWEELYEPLYWQNTPMARNDGFPTRIALLRSSKTEAQFPGHFARANEVADWVETLGYVAGNPLDISFDNVTVSAGGSFSDNFEDGDYNGWTRAAGCANWAVQTSAVANGRATGYDRYTTYALNAAAKRLSFKLKADANATVDKVYLYARYVGGGITCRVDLVKDSAGLPKGGVVATATFVPSSSTFLWVPADLSNFKWSAGSTYHLVLSYVSGAISTARYVQVQYVGFNTPDRNVLYSSNGGSTWTTQNYEPAFRIDYAEGGNLSQPYASYSSIGILGATRYGQQFRPTESVYVRNLSVLLRKDATVSGDARVQVRRWSDKAVLASSTVARASIATTNRWISFAFSPAVLLGGGTQYFFEVVNLGTTGSYYMVRENTLGSYGAYTWDGTANAAVYSANTGVTWSAQTHYDFGYTISGYSRNKALRTWRIGNSDNLLVSTGVYTNFTFSTDVRYNKQDNYFDDAEIYFHYKDRANYYRVGIRNFYAFWRLKYVVMANSNIVAQGWVYDFAKTNRPVENTWYNLKVEVNGITNKVFFDNVHVGTFWATNNPSGKIAVGSRALQLGNWEPQKGYYFVDDDEWSFWAPEGQAQTQGKPVNLDPGYLNAFFNTMLLPSVYVMSDIEVSNLKAWLTNSMNSLIVFDGGLAMKKETGASGLGRIESMLGVAASTRAMSNVTKTVIGGTDHYVTLDYAPAAQITAKGSGTAYTTLGGGLALGTLQNAATSAPAHIATVLMNNPAAPVKVFCFNYPADTQGQLTNEARNIARRAFEWSRGNAFKCQVSLMYDTGGDPTYDFAVYTTNVWVLAGTGSNSVTFTLPNDGIMTGTNLYWAYTVYPWDSGSQWWANHQGFYSSEQDARVRIPGKGLQLIGQPTNAWGGRQWELWLAYNTEGQQAVLTYGLKDKGLLQVEDNFDDGNYAGWTVKTHPNIAWSVTGGALRASVVSTGGYAFITKDGLALNNTNLTFEYYTRFMNGARHGGAVYKGVVLYANPQLCGWSDNNQNYVTNGTGITTGRWHHVVVNIRDGVPMMRSDLIVDGRYIFMDEPIEVTSFATNNLGLLSPYNPGYIEWDNVRVADEQYSFVTQTVSGVYYPTSAISPHWGTVPDYDGSMWEHNGTLAGSRYEWFAYLAGQGLHDGKAVDVFFAPRIMDENTNFPAVFNPGQTVQVPVEWEQLPQTPMVMTLTLQDAWNGTVYATNTVWLPTASGSGLFPVPIPEQTPASASYQWSAFVYPTNANPPWEGRLGADDTFRYGRDGGAVEAEVMVIGTAVVGGDFMVYRDSGIPVGGEIYTWAGGAATFDGNYAGGTPPEGSKCFRTDCSSWAGWGVFSATGAVNMTEYRDGFLKFWLRSSATVKIDLEDWSGAKSTQYVPTTSNAWKEITIPVSAFTGINLAQIKGYFEITSDTATTFYIDHVRYVKGIYPVYRDAGIAPKCRIVTTNGAGAALFNANYTDGAAPEGAACYLATGATWVGWSVVSTNGVIDMSLYTNGFLCFWARSAAGLKVEIEAPAGTFRATTIPTTTNTWKEFRIPLTTFGGFNYAQVKTLFKISSTNATSFMVDDVSWKKGTNAVPSEKKETFYSDAGIPVGTDISVWWANEYWTHLSATLYDGGFESSTIGAFPNSGYWLRAGVGAAATAQVSAAALRSGTRGLREQTDTATTSTWVSAYSEIQGYAGDINNMSVYIRQPTGTTWVAGSTAFLRMRFLDAWRAVVTDVVSSVKVTTAGQAWTLCSIPNTTAPYGTRFIRCELVVQKPSGSAGVSIADFDDTWWGQGNSFYGQYAEDPVTPEGTKSFRSYLVYWSGWGVFYTNATATTNLSQYANGYLKFWYKSAGSTRVEIMSVYNGVTNKAAYPSSGWFGPTLNESGQVVWKQISIPISSFAGVNLAYIKSPFMVTDPTYDSAFYVDDVRWTMTP